MDSEAEGFCRDIYRKTKEMYAAIPDGPWNLGFQILLGPPLIEAPILFIGYQPGKGTLSPAQEREKGNEDGWPSKCEYATETWRLARNMQRMFSKKLLEQCVGVNAIFVRSPSLKNTTSSRDFKKHR